MMQWLHDGWSQVVDGCSFGFINALQWRGRGGAHDGRAMEEYVGRWEGAALEDYYPVPGGVMEFPERGRAIVPSPLGSGCAENDHIFLDYWPGPRGWGSPVMLLLHGMMSVSDVGYRLWARTLNRLGWGAVFFHLPYHYGRRPRGALSGEMALTSNLIRSAEAIRQAVVELRWVMRTLEARGVPRVGVWGTSYGGWIGSLLAVLEPRLAAAWLLEPIVDVDWAVWESPATRTLRAQLRRRGIPRELVKRHVRLVCPLHHAPGLPAERVLLLAGRFDRIASPESIRRLHGRWEGSVYREYRQGHVGYQLMPESLGIARGRWPELFADAAI